MDIQNLFLVAVIILLLYLVVSFFYAAPPTTPLTSAFTEQTINIPNSVMTGSQSSNNTFSIWFYINDFNSIPASYTTFVCNNMPGLTTSYPTDNLTTADKGILFSQSGYIKSQFFSDNSLRIAIPIKSCTTGEPNLISVSNIPIQKWTHLIVTTTQSTADCYIDGKLNYTINLSSPTTCNIETPVYVTPQVGFNGYTAMFQYLPNTINPQQAWDMYSAGYGNSMYNNLFGAYNIQLSILDNGTVQHSLTI